MSKNYLDFQEKFGLDSLVIFKTEYWIWSLRPIQVTIGSGILSLKRPEEQLSKITDEESKDLIKIVRVIEDTLKSLLNYKRINYLMLMMVDFHIHYHVIPRYDIEVECIGKTWKDNDWPKPPTVSGTPNDINTLQAILAVIKGNLIY